MNGWNLAEEVYCIVQGKEIVDFQGEKEKVAMKKETKGQFNRKDVRSSPTKGD